MVKSVSSAWIWFLGLFLLIFTILATGLFFYNRKTSMNLRTYRDSLQTYKKLYTDLKHDYVILDNKYKILLESVQKGSYQLGKMESQVIQLEQIIRKQDSILKKVREEAQKALSGYAGDELEVQPRNGKLYVTMRNKLLFPLGSATVQPSGITALGKLAQVLKQNPDLQVMIEGHTDNIDIKPGTPCWKDNWDLSAARAISVARILINRFGVDPARIEIAGRSKYDPVKPNINPQWKALNRRIEIIIFPDQTEMYEILDQTQTP